MSLGRKKARQEQLWVSCREMPASPGNPFYEKLNGILDKEGFDAFVENLCVPYYAHNVGRRSIPPGRYFRMLLLGYFEGIDYFFYLDSRHFIYCARTGLLNEISSAPRHIQLTEEERQRVSSELSVISN